jgi:hypothetical protein
VLELSLDYESLRAASFLGAQLEALETIRMSHYKIALLTALLAPLPPTLAAQEHFTLGPISRIILIDIKPGRASEFWTDLRRTIRPLFDEYKKHGLIENYAVNLKSTTEGLQDWDVALILTFRNWAALDTFATKGDSVSMSYYGSYGKRSTSGRQRSDFSTTVGSFLVRNVTLKELPREPKR